MRWLTGGGPGDSGGEEDELELVEASVTDSWAESCASFSGSDPESSPEALLEWESSPSSCATVTVGEIESSPEIPSKGGEVTESLWGVEVAVGLGVWGTSSGAVTEGEGGEAVAG